jgi:hypothetical protein
MPACNVSKATSQNGIIDGGGALCIIIIIHDANLGTILPTAHLAGRLLFDTFSAVGTFALLINLPYFHCYFFSPHIYVQLFSSGDNQNIYKSYI